MRVSTKLSPSFAAATPVPKPPRHLPRTRQELYAFAAIAVLATFTRFVGLTSPHVSGTPVFDEKHYVPQAWDMVRSYHNFFLGGIESNPGYGLVVHPPLGKQILAIGEAMFGYTPLGWRVMPALFGVAIILLIFELTRTLTQSWKIGLIAGFIACFDGVLLVGAKFGMLDIFQTAFVVAAAVMLAHDHRQVHQRLHDSWRSGTITTSPLGPRLGFRWWRFGAGIMLGLALSVKWSGLYYIAFFGLMSVFSDLYLRRRYGVPRFTLGTLYRDTVPALGSIVAVPALLYLWSWRAWFASETSVYRHAATDGTIDADSPLAILPIPDAFASWLYYHFSVLEFHSELTTSGGHSHPWDSKPWSWLAATRPILYYTQKDASCPLGSGTCDAQIFLFGTPAIWWLTVPVLLWGIYRWFISKDMNMVIPVVAFAAGFIPWLIAYDRQMYFFYAMPLVPFTIVLLALACGYLWGRGNQLSRWPLTTGSMAVVVYLALVVAMFLFFAPLLYGIPVPDWYRNAMAWLPSWT